MIRLLRTQLWISRRFVYSSRSLSGPWLDSGSSLEEEKGRNHRNQGSAICPAVRWLSQDAQTTGSTSMSIELAAAISFIWVLLIPGAVLWLAAGPHRRTPLVPVAEECSHAPGCEQRHRSHPRVATRRISSR